jgi:hypothetical protein
MGQRLDSADQVDDKSESEVELPICAMAEARLTNR